MSGIVTQVLYRVLKKTTGSLQPDGLSTFWNTEVLYCGYDRLEALRVYWKHEPEEQYRGYGSRCAKVTAQAITDQGEIEAATVELLDRLVGDRCLKIEAEGSAWRRCSLDADHEHGHDYRGGWTISERPQGAWL